MQVERVLGALEAHGCAPHKYGAGWRARCPAHADGTPSLSIALGRDGRMLLHCWAGCEVKAILAVLRLRWSDLFPDVRRAQS
jgi:hypothetical protein